MTRMTEIVLLLLLFVTYVSGYVSTCRQMRASTSRQMFGTKKPATGGKVIIKVDGKTIESSEKSVNLRKELMANGVDVYPFRAKITGNCGGAGICGTCAVKVIDGMQNFNPPSKNEQNTLKGKPADFRLSCCSKVSGPCTIKTKP